ASRRDSTREEFCRRHGVPRLEASLVEETQDTAVVEDDARGRVAEGPGIGPDHRAQDPSVTCSGSWAEATASSTARWPVIRDWKARRATPMRASPPRIAWSRRLPDPASRYAKMLIAQQSGTTSPVGTGFNVCKRGSRRAPLPRCGPGDRDARDERWSPASPGGSAARSGRTGTI